MPYNSLPTVLVRTPARLGDLIKDTAKKIGVDERAVFLKVFEEKGFSNAQECANYRYERWFKYGEITKPVEDYCLLHWRSDAIEHAA